MRCLLANLTVDPSDFFNKMDKAGGVVGGVVVNTLRTNGLDLERHAKQLAPLDEGTLTASGHTSRAKRIAGGHEVVVSFNTSYAEEVHETMEPAAGGRKPGLGTRAKPLTRFGPAGGKYLERPLLGMRKEYSKRIANALKRKLK